MKTSLVKQQAGASILEILVSILILSIAVLALGGLQAKSIAAASDAKYRVEATTYADQMIGTMWADRANLATYPTFAAPAAAAWRTQEPQATTALPGAAANAPTITVTPGQPRRSRRGGAHEREPGQRHREVGAALACRAACRRTR